MYRRRYNIDTHYKLSRIQASLLYCTILYCIQASLRRWSSTSLWWVWTASTRDQWWASRNDFVIDLGQKYLLFWSSKYLKQVEKKYILNILLRSPNLYYIPDVRCGHLLRAVVGRPPAEAAGQHGLRVQAAARGVAREASQCAAHGANYEAMREGSLCISVK